MEEAPKERIPKETYYLMLGTALFFDLISLVPGLNIVVIVFASLTFALWFAIRGVSFTKNKKISRAGLVGIGIDVIPGASVLPAITYAVWRIVSVTRKEDKERVAKASSKVSLRPSDNK